MRSIRNATISAVCVAALCGAAILWHAYKTKANEQKLAKEASACRVRAEQGDAKSEYDLSHMYYHGQGVPQDRTEALKWSHKAADQGYANAEYDLGYSFYYGQGLPQNYAKAASWYLKAADQDSSYAQEELGYMYCHGYRVSQNYAQALTWLRKAADQGSAYAMTEIGRMYYHGQGVPQDSAQAVNWYRKAADQGYASAESELGFMLWYGHGVPVDRPEAYHWFRKAAMQGDQYATRAISKEPGRITQIKLFLEVIAGLFLGTSCFSLNKFEPATGLGDPKRGLKVVTGLLCLFSAGLDWYGYTHHKMWSVVYGPNAFTVVARLLHYAILVLLYFVLVDGKPRTEQAEIVAGDTAEAKEYGTNL
jgi:hypothetical protein